jgi:hypothetical protein
MSRTFTIAVHVRFYAQTVSIKWNMARGHVHEYRRKVSARNAGDRLFTFQHLTAPATPVSQAVLRNVSRAHDRNAFIHVLSFLYERGFSFFSFHRAERPTPETLTTLKRTPGISPLALPLRPNPERRTSSFSSTKFKQPSLGTAWFVSRLFVGVLEFGGVPYRKR